MVIRKIARLFFKRVNRFDGACRLIGGWSDPPQPHRVALEVSSVGNINTSGVPGRLCGHALVRSHPQFVASLEPGIRELVLLLCDDFKWITYTSCQGHAYDDPKVYNMERSVGLLPRTHEEYLLMLRIFDRAAYEVNRGRFLSPVRLIVEKERLDDGGRARPVVFLTFAARYFYCRRGWALYFKVLDKAYRSTLAHLSLLLLKSG